MPSIDTRLIARSHAEQLINTLLSVNCPSKRIYFSAEPSGSNSALRIHRVNRGNWFWKPADFKRWNSLGFMALILSRLFFSFKQKRRWLGNQESKNREGGRNKEHHPIREVSRWKWEHIKVKKCKRGKKYRTSSNKHWLRGIFGKHSDCSLLLDWKEKLSAENEVV